MRRVEPVEQVCAQCGQTFNVPPYEANRRVGKFCSWACYLVPRWPGRAPRGERGSRPPRAETTRYLEALQAGKTVAEVAAEFGVTRQAIDSAAKRAGIKPVSAHAVKWQRQIARATEVVQAGGGVREVAAALAVGITGAYNVLRKAGLQSVLSERRAETRRYCPIGHDTAVTGRYKDGRCKVCQDEANRRQVARIKADPERLARLRAQQRERQRRYWAKKRAEGTAA